MIKVNNLDKFFNKGQSNEIHVINDLTLELPDKGLIVLLGPSGSGKTTLLNVLGGLDKVQSGSITFDEEEINHYKSATWDKIRNQKVGYIFQNYNLLHNLTVYDNISLTLNMIGIYEKEEIDKRIDYILERIGMINYRKRRASQLSGGQQQRVAIARALAKNPQVIIADEPTGNLDSKNTQEVMDIIKRISLTKLVVLVTHEENIANFYGDRIIRLCDGEIVSDIQNTSNGSLDVKHDTDIYLGDLRNISNIEDETNSFKLYSDEDINDKVDIRLIVKNKTIYVDLQSQEYKKMQLLESDSEIKIFDKKYEKIKRSDMNGIEEFDLESIITKGDEYTKHSVFSVNDSIKLAWRRMKSSTMFGKLFYLGFVFIAALIALSLGMLNGVLTHTPSEFLESPKELVEITRGELTLDEMLAYEDKDSINYIQVVDSVNLTVNLPSVYQSWQNTAQLSADVAYSEFMDESKLVAGRTVNDYNEMVISQRIADEYIKNGTYQQLGITSYQDLFNLTIVEEYTSQNGLVNYEMKIVGIVEDDAKVTYMERDTIFFLTTKQGTVEMFTDAVTMTDKQDLTDKIVVYQYNDESDFSSLLGTKLSTQNDIDIYLEGLYTSDKNVPVQLIKSEDLERLLLASNTTNFGSKVYYHSNNVSKTLSIFEDDKVTAVSVFDFQKQQYASRRIPGAISTIIFASVVLGASAIMYFLVIRSNLLSRIYEVSVYRGLGVSKNDIRKMFTTEIIMISTITSLVGYAAMTFVLYRIQLLSQDYIDIIHISPLSIIGGVVLIYAVNIFSGLIPVSNLIRKTPAEIFSKYDF
jgi:ABC-type lipoprotein export system ATPase subunit/ABC-type antimicrobial peptide transport system permease subunit